MNRTHAPLALCVTALLATPAAAGIITDTLGVADTELDVSLVGATLSITSTNGVLLTHDDPINCTGHGTPQIVCAMVDDVTVRTRSGDDHVRVWLDAPHNPHRLTVLTRQGDDTVEVMQADGGALSIEGGRGTDTFDLGAPQSRLAVEPFTRMWIYNGGTSVDPGDTFNVHVDTEGFIFLQGNGGVDTFDISGTITRTADCDAAIDVRGQPGADVFALDVDHVETVLAGSARAVLSIDAGDGSDALTWASDVTVLGGVVEVWGGSGHDVLDLAGHGFALISDGDYSPSTEAVVRLRGGLGTDTLLDDGGYTTGDTGGNPPVVVYDVAGW